METFYTDNQTYVATVAQLQDIEQSLATAPGSSLAVTGTAVDAYTLDVTSVTGNHFSIAKAATGVVTRSCTRPNTKGGCPATTVW
jgi:hypothetical protein